MTLPIEAPIRRLGPADLKACLALSVDRQRSAEERKWTLLLEAAEAYGVDDPDGGGLAGTVVLGRYGPKLASVGMMLVASHYAGRASAASSWATSSGRPVTRPCSSPRRATAVRCTKNSASARLAGARRSSAGSGPLPQPGPI